MSDIESAPKAEPADEETPKVKKPVIKPRKKFVPQKKQFKSDKPMEHRTRHIRLASLDAANLIRQTIVDLQKELAEQPMDDLDKEFLDQHKVEKFFMKLAKKYSACSTREMGGDLQWVLKIPQKEDKDIGEQYDKSEFLSQMPQFNNVLSPELVDAIMQAEKHKIPEPIKSGLGYHIILVCETRVAPIIEEPKEDKRSLIDDIHKNADHSQVRQWGSDVAPN